MNWFALFFGPYYYAGYGKMRKGVVMAILGSMPITAIMVNIYAALNANKELPVGQIDFDWKSSLITLAIGLASSALLLILIQSFK